MHRAILFLSTLIFCANAFAEAPRASLQIKDLEDLADLTDHLLAGIESANGSLLLETGTYRITRPLEIRLEQKQRVHIRSLNGPVTLIMDGPGPALRLVGSHEGTASPKSFEPATWNESFPIIEGLEILGSHPESIGIELVRCVKPTITRVSIRWCHNGIVLSERNRNVTISDVHLYENSGIGLFLNDVNLHQINVANSHISYNREGGIVVRNGNVRNLQIANCDIEANMPADDTPTTAANVVLDVSGAADNPRISIAEVAITGSTIQHSSNYTRGDMEEIAPGGANIRILGNEEYLIDSVTIHGNIISDTSVLVDVSHAMDVNFTGNAFFAPNP
ncbi:MAG: right-handed parallel beta-helix repeat-containing protein, partial [Verrucomicrobiota bacterium]